MAARWLLRWNAARRIVANATPASLDAPDALPVGADTHALALRVTPNRIEPGVFGIVRPVLLPPRNIFHALQPAQLETLVAHEAGRAVAPASTDGMPVFVSGQFPYAGPHTHRATT